MRLKTEVSLLRNLYFLVFFLGVGVVILLHSVPKPFFDLLRVPSFIEEISFRNGLDYFASFRIYQITLIFSFFLILTDAVCLTKHVTKLILQISEGSSLIGVLLMIVSLLYFTYNLLFVDANLRWTPIIFIGTAAFIIILDLITFNVDEKLFKGDIKNV